jgi:hypothetical protein
MRLPLNLNIAPFKSRSSRPSPGPGPGPGRLARARQKKAPLKPAPAAACYSVALAAGPGSEGGAQPTGRPRRGHCAVAACTSHRLGHNTQHQPTTQHTTPAHCQTPACQLPDPKLRGDRRSGGYWQSPRATAGYKFYAQPGQRSESRPGGLRLTSKAGLRSERPNATEWHKGKYRGNAIESSNARLLRRLSHPCVAQI